MSGLDLYDICVSKLENHMLRLMIEKTKRGFVLQLSNSDIEKEFSISDKKVKTFIKKMKDANFIRGSRGVYITNPFMFIPHGMNDAEISTAQESWIE